MIRLKRLYAHDFKQLRNVEIHFPEAGRILVQGKNEAGKSTLFEAVYFALFGQALSTEGGARNLDDLIAYDQEKARVELDLQVGDRVFKITRTLVRGKPNKWELEIVRPDGTFEEIRSLKAVNDRLVRELGFDAEALLNTCFVEQKKLEKLEGMSKAKREESLSKILNLERLLEMEDKLKLRGEDEKLLTRLAHRVELAHAQAELPGVADELGRAEGLLRLLELRVNIEKAIQEICAQEQLANQIKELAEKRETLQAAVARVDALDRARQILDATLLRYDALTEDAKKFSELQTERAEIARAVDEQLPALETRQRDIRRLGQQAARLTRVEAVRGSVLSELQRAQNLNQELDGHFERGANLNETVTQLETRLLELDDKLRAYEVGDALGDWANALQETLPPAKDEEILKAKRQERDTLNRQQRKYLIYLGAIVVGIGLASTLVMPALVLTTRDLFLGVLVALVVAALATLGVILVAARLIQTNRQAARVIQEIGNWEGVLSAQQQLTNAAQTRVDTALERLRALEIPIPASISAAQARRIEIAATLENKTRAELQVERDETREKLNYARAQRDEVVKRINELSPTQNGANVPQLESKLSKAERVLSQWRPRIARRAAQYDLAPETQALRDAYRDTLSDLKALNERVARADKLASDAARIQQRMDKTGGEIREQYIQATALLNGSTPKWSPHLAREAYLDVQAQLTAAFQAAGGEQVRAQMAQLENQFGALEREQAIRSRNAREAMHAARAIESELSIEGGLSAEPTLAELQTLAERLAETNLDERPALEARVKRLNQRVGELRGTQERFERELGLLGEIVEVEEAERELAQTQREQAQRQYGAEIVARARRRIVQKILPATMEYMRRILPQLTRDRYHDAELDPDSYKIKVWDERAGQSGAWKEKNIFSGGTKDQFSLALRLAFALATLPQERGTSPGFIFLDEPLGSFDAERANALLYLLTEGEIGRAFDQIFLISHVSVQAEKFTHHLRVENGVVTSET
jgi:exonuclease SbcC